MAVGQIRKALSGFYYVYADGKTYQTRGRGNFRKRDMTPLVGDFVEFESSNPTDGYLLDLLPRRNALVRPPIVNVDLGVVIMSCKEPDFSSYLLDRFLVSLAQKDVKAVIYLTKTDLTSATEFQKLEKYQAIYQKIGYDFILPSATTLKGAQQELIAHFERQTLFFMGQSGAGKSTLLNAIAPHLDLKTAEISQALNRGKHTTRHVELLPLFGGLVADTPGFSNISFFDLKAEELGDYFPEIAEASRSCKFRECIHDHEPGCQVKTEVSMGEITQERYDNYLQFLKEIQQQKVVYNKKK